MRPSSNPSLMVNVHIQLTLIVVVIVQISVQMETVVKNQLSINQSQSVSPTHSPETKHAMPCRVKYSHQTIVVNVHITHTLMGPTVLIYLIANA